MSMKWKTFHRNLIFLPEKSIEVYVFWDDSIRKFAGNQQCFELVLHDKNQLTNPPPWQIFLKVPK